VLQPRRLPVEIARIDGGAIEPNQATDTTHVRPPPPLWLRDDQRENRCGVNGDDRRR
jgi:hypothetical protein